MNLMTTGAKLRHTLRPSHADRRPTVTRFAACGPAEFSSLGLSTIDLRRIVADMVD